MAIDQSLLGNRRTQDPRAQIYTDSQDYIRSRAIVCTFRYTLDEDVSVLSLGVPELGMPEQSREFVRQCLWVTSAYRLS